MREMDIKEIEDEVLKPLNDILLLSYGTEVYGQVLDKIKKTIYTLEQQRIKCEN